MDKKQLPENATPAESAGLARAKRGLPVTQRSVVRVTREDLLQADKVLIEGLEVFANHGVYPAENELGQKFMVSLTLTATYMKRVPRTIWMPRWTTVPCATTWTSSCASTRSS